MPTLAGKWRVFNDTTNEPPGFAIYERVDGVKLTYRLYSEPQEHPDFLIDQGTIQKKNPSSYIYTSQHQNPQGQGVLLAEGSKWTWQHSGGDHLHQGHLEAGWGSD